MFSSLVVLSRDLRGRASTKPVEDVLGMEPPSSDTESLRAQQPAPVRASHRLFVAADEAGHLEGCEQPVG